MSAPPFPGASQLVPASPHVCTHACTHTCTHTYVLTFRETAQGMYLGLLTRPLPPLARAARRRIGRTRWACRAIHAEHLAGGYSHRMLSRSRDPTTHGTQDVVEPPRRLMTNPGIRPRRPVGEAELVRVIWVAEGAQRLSSCLCRSLLWRYPAAPSRKKGMRVKKVEQPKRAED